MKEGCTIVVVICVITGVVVADENAAAVTPAVFHIKIEVDRGGAVFVFVFVFVAALR